MNHLINERLDISNYRVDELEVMDKEINDFISTLWDKYEEDIEILL